MINDYHALALGLATREEIDTICRMTFAINEILKARYLQANLILVDFKIEFGRYHGQIVLADEISPDTCRLWDVDTHEKLDKDRFRRDLGGSRRPTSRWPSACWQTDPAAGRWPGAPRPERPMDRSRCAAPPALRAPIRRPMPDKKEEK